MRVASRSAELRQRELLRQLQEQEDELGRVQRRGEYTRTLEDKARPPRWQLTVHAPLQKCTSLKTLPRRSAQ